MKRSQPTQPWFSIKDLIFSQEKLVSRVKMLPKTLRYEIAKYSQRILYKDKLQAIQTLEYCHPKLYKKWVSQAPFLPEMTPKQTNLVKKSVQRQFFGKYQSQYQTFDPLNTFMYFGDLNQKPAKEIEFHGSGLCIDFQDKSIEEGIYINDIEQGVHRTVWKDAVVFTQYFNGVKVGKETQYLDQGVEIQKVFHYGKEIQEIEYRTDQVMRITMFDADGKIKKQKWTMWEYKKEERQRVKGVKLSENQIDFSEEYEKFDQIPFYFIKKWTQEATIFYEPLVFDQLKDQKIFALQTEDQDDFYMLASFLEKLKYQKNEQGIWQI